MKKGLLLPLLLGLVVIQSFLVIAVFSPGAFPGGDNAGYVALADALVERGAYVETWEPGAPSHTKYPPVFAGVLALMIAAGAERWVTLKLVSAVAAVGVTGLTFLWARRRVPELAAAGVALVTGVSATLLYHSRYILSDVPFLLFLMGALAVLDRGFVWRSARSLASTPSSGAEEADPLPVFATRRGEERGPSAATVAVGGLLVLLACFTRTAGLPLFLALLGALAFRRAWKPLVGSALLVGLPWLLWALRSGSGQGRYGSEFFLVNPYDPALGRVDIAGLIGRVLANVEGYLTVHIPAAIGALAPGDGATLLGGALVVAAAAGWVIAFRRGAGIVEIFAPLYLGLILIWPEVWSGERFAMPLVPILLLYGVEAIAAASRRVLPGASLVRAAGQGAFLLLIALPAFSNVGSLRAEAEECRAAIRATQGNPWSCSGLGQMEFVAAARWSGNLLPEGSVVLSRKPRIFHVESGLPSRVYPFEDDPAALFAEADAIGARYLVYDRISSQAPRYLGGAIQQRPERFCGVRSFRLGGPEGGTELLGILPAGQAGGSTGGAGGVRIQECPADYVRSEIEPFADPVDRIPSLIRPE